MWKSKKRNVCTQTAANNHNDNQLKNFAGAKSVNEFFSHGRRRMPFFFLAPPLGYYRAERFQPDRVQLVFHYNKYLKMENAQRCGTGDELASIFTAKKMRENIAREMNEEKMIHFNLCNVHV